ncbi:hypothetical protein FEM48_Zijuj01G0201800 [Ziziphus jujuba var. spinosa]|uniref:Uncharacterized protein n=1 Tax=Ziziphus jujuba var. spinosa TaxID=714518 RepID=A0A978W3B3_ZIZJJ|nr:hypothetical protein FEM48_Zijuj01G0201800 [Ziziphus jujuba var. spinosa]
MELELFHAVAEDIHTLTSGTVMNDFDYLWSPNEFTAIAASGTFTLGVDPNNTNQLVVWQRGKLFWQSGNRNGHNFTYFPASGPFNDLEKNSKKKRYLWVIIVSPLVFLIVVAVVCSLCYFRFLKDNSRGFHIALVMLVSGTKKK